MPGLRQRELEAIPAIRSDDPADENRNASRVLTKRYLDKLSRLETELETERPKLVILRQEEAQAQEQLEEFLKALVAE